MKTLWTFGDSLTAPFDYAYTWSADYIKWKGYVPKVYGNIISEKLGYQLKNLGVGGSDNYSIFQAFCDVSHKIKENDLVIFGWSSPIRFRLVNINGSWLTILPNYENRYLECKNITEETLSQIIINRENFRYVDEVNSWIRMITNFVKNVDIIHWTAFDSRIMSIHINGLDLIKDETNGLVMDTHFSEKGQQQLSEILLNHFNNINRTQKIKLI
jgi:hypothetical protein